MIERTLTRVITSQHPQPTPPTTNDSTSTSSFTRRARACVGDGRACSPVLFGSQAVALPERVNTALGGVTAAYEGFQDSFEGCLVGFITSGMVNADGAVEDLQDGVADGLLGLENSGLSKLADSVSFSQRADQNGSPLRGYRCCCTPVLNKIQLTARLEHLFLVALYPRLACAQQNRARLACAVHTQQGLLWTKTTPTSLVFMAEA